MSTLDAGMQQRRDTAANWTYNNPVLSSGEIGFETDTNRIKIGIGDDWNDTDYVVPDLYRGLDVFASGKPADEEILAVVPITSIRAFRLAAGGAGIGAVSLTAATASATVTIEKNGTPVATIAWSAAGTTGTPTVSTDVDFEAGDVLTILAPTPVDATLADIGISLGGERI